MGVAFKGNRSMGSSDMGDDFIQATYCVQPTAPPWDRVAPANELGIACALSPTNSLAALVLGAIPRQSRGLSWLGLFHSAMVAILTLLLLTPQLAHAQIGLAEQAAVSDIQQEMAGGRNNRNNNANNNAAATNTASSDSPAELISPDNWDKWNDDHSIKRSKRDFLGWPKVLLAVIALALWVFIGDWINRDCQIFQINYLVWNSVYLAIGVVAASTVFFLPAAAALPVLYLASIGPLIAFAITHNKTVEQHQRIFTPDWFRHQAAVVASKMGMKVNTEQKADYMQGAAVDLIARGADDPTKNKANLLTARQSPGYVLVKQLIADAVEGRAEQVMLDFRSDSVATRRLIDGVWHTGEPVERDSGDVMLAVMKQLANLKPAERVKKQAGSIGADYEKSHYNVSILSQGVKTGERVLVSLKEIGAKSLATYAELGMRDKIREQWEAVMAADQGLAVVSAQSGGGLTTLFDVSLMETDRLMRDFFSIEDVQHPEREIENVVVKTYDSKKGESPVTNLDKLIRQYPNVYVCRDLVNAESAKALLAEVKDEKLLITSTHAKEAPEALLRLLQKKVPHKDLVETVTAVINMRLIRLLCDQCKVGHEPAPALLQKLGIPEGKVEMLYAPPNPEEEKKPCKKCSGLGYFGRTGLFELLIVNDQVREVLLKKPKMEYLKKAARNAGMRTHQEEGILLVSKGATSLAELQRVLSS